MLKKREIVAYTKRLDKVANEVQQNWRKYDLSKKAAYDFCLQVDSLSDKIESLVGINKKSDVIEKQPDEPYMDHFDADGVLETLDEDVADGTDDYMDHYEDGDDSWSHEEPLEGPTQDELTRGKGADWYGKSASKESSTKDYWSQSKTSNNWYEKSSSKSTKDYWSESSRSDYWG